MTIVYGPAGKMTEDQQRAVFKFMMNQEWRAADVGVMQIQGNTVEQFAEYVWDHWMGEPENPTVEQVQKLALDFLNNELPVATFIYQGPEGELEQWSTPCQSIADAWWRAMVNADKYLMAGDSSAMTGLLFTGFVEKG